MGIARKEMEYDKQCLGNRAYIRLGGILKSQQRMLNIDFDGGLSSWEGKIDSVYGWRIPFL